MSCLSVSFLGQDHDKSSPWVLGRSKIRSTSRELNALLKSGDLTKFYRQPGSAKARVMLPTTSCLAARPSQSVKGSSRAMRRMRNVYLYVHRGMLLHNMCRTPMLNSCSMIYSVCIWRHPYLQSPAHISREDELAISLLEICALHQSAAWIYKIRAVAGVSLNDA